ETADELEPEYAAVIEATPGWGHLPLHHGGHERVGARADVETVITGRGHADHRHGVTVEPDGLVEDGRIPGEAGSPVIVGQDDHRMRAGEPIVFRRDAAAQYGRDAERIEPGTRDQFRLNAFAAIVVGQIERRSKARGHAGQDTVM